MLNENENKIVKNISRIMTDMNEYNCVVLC